MLQRLRDVSDSFSTLSVHVEVEVKTNELEEHREAKRQKAREAYYRNHEESKKRKREWDRRHRASMTEEEKANYRLKDRIKHKLWAKRNPEKVEQKREANKIRSRKWLKNLTKEQREEMNRKRREQRRIRMLLETPEEREKVAEGKR